MVPLVRRVETNSGHIYLDDKDDRVPGVTTVLQNLPKPALIDWKVKSAVRLALNTDKHPKRKPLEGEQLVAWCAESGDRTARKAADLGTAAHDWAEAHMNGEDVDAEELSAAVRPMVDCYLRFVEDWKPSPVLVERLFVYVSPKTGRPMYCGTGDLVADLKDGNRWMLDWKGQTKSPRTTHALQLAAYANSTHWVDEEGELHPMVQCDKGAVILLNGSPDTCYRMYEADISKDTFNVFMYLLRIHRFMQHEDEVLLGLVDPR